MEEGDLFRYKHEVLEVCHSDNNACGQCFAFGHQPKCFNMPICIGGRYFRRLSPYEVRKAVREKRIIHDYK